MGSMNTSRNNFQQKNAAQADLRERVLQHFQELQFREAALAAYRNRHASTLAVAHEPLAAVF